jgi:hypothetical protein
MCQCIVHFREEAIWEEGVVQHQKFRSPKSGVNPDRWVKRMHGEKISYFGRGALRRVSLVSSGVKHELSKF